MKTLQQFAAAISVMREIDPEIQAQTLAVFLEVSQHPHGILQRDLEAAAGISQSSVSRNIALLSHTQRQGRPGYDLLVSFEDPAERRRKLVRLTPKGERYAGKLSCV
jgi:DNA-binding MarR family transcriptional regulator